MRADSGKYRLAAARIVGFTPTRSSLNGAVMNAAGAASAVMWTRSSANAPTRKSESVTYSSHPHKPATPLRVAARAAVPSSTSCSFIGATSETPCCLNFKEPRERGMLRNFYLDLYPYLYFYSSARWHYRSYSLAGSRRRRRHSVRGNIPGSAGTKYRHKRAYCPDTLVWAPTRGPGLVLTQK